jgi:molybdopterin converting factor small subunit
VTLPATLKERAGGRAEFEVEGPDLAGVLFQLEQDCPSLTGWILDERGQLRRHVNVFVNGERAPLDYVVGADDLIRVIPAISGGSEEVELLVGTRKGLVVLRGERGGPLAVVARGFQGQPVEFAIRDHRTGVYYAAVTHAHYGPKVFFTEDAAGEWTQSQGPAFPDFADASVARIWSIRPGQTDGVLWAGVAPAALFKSEDGGITWALNRALWEVPGRDRWQGGAGGLCMHSICPWPGDPSRLAVAISAAGVWITDDGGDSWRWGVDGLVPRYLPKESLAGTTDYCVHNLHRAVLRPETMYMQFHGGVYRSDDAGETWLDIASGLPSDFGFPLVADPHDPDHAYVIPLRGAEDRVPPEGRLRVYETRDAGNTWAALAEGLPQEHAYHTTLRQAFGHDGRDPLGLYFGTEQGTVFGSADAGASWALAADGLPPVLSVRCS